MAASIRTAPVRVARPRGRAEAGPVGTFRMRIGECSGGASWKCADIFSAPIFKFFARTCKFEGGSVPRFRIGCAGRPANRTYPGLRPPVAGKGVRRPFGAASGRSARLRRVAGKGAVFGNPVRGLHRQGRAIGGPEGLRIVRGAGDPAGSRRVLSSRGLHPLFCGGSEIFKFEGFTGSWPRLRSRAVGKPSRPGGLAGAGPCGAAGEWIDGLDPCREFRSCRRSLL